jgi:hypothetical protein
MAMASRFNDPSGQLFPISVLQQINDFFQAPSMISDPSIHRGRNTQALMNTGENVLTEVEGQRVRVVLKLLSAPVC